MQQTTIYPKCYLNIYKAITQPVPYSLFPERVQSVLAAMIEFNLLELIDGIIHPTPNNALPKDFTDQLAMI